MKLRTLSFCVLGLLGASCAHSLQAPPGNEKSVQEVPNDESQQVDAKEKQNSVSNSALQRINRLNKKQELKSGQTLYIPVSEKTLQSADLRGRTKKDADPFADSEMDDAMESGRRGELYTQFRALQWPLEGKVMSPFGRRHGRPHKGIDIFPVNNEKNIRAARGGVVEFAGRKSKFGNVVVINHGSFKTLYAHCSKILVKKGQDVENGEEIAVVGRSGNAEGTHLHFEYRTLADRSLDPMPHFQREFAH